MTNQCEHGQLARVCELCAKDAEIAGLSAALKASHEAIVHYERALTLAFPWGAKGESFEHWNAARAALGDKP